MNITIWTDTIKDIWTHESMFGGVHVTFSLGSNSVTVRVTEKDLLNARDSVHETSYGSGWAYLPEGLTIFAMKPDEILDILAKIDVALDHNFAEKETI